METNSTIEFLYAQAILMKMRTAGIINRKVYEEAYKSLSEKFK